MNDRKTKKSTRPEASAPRVVAKGMTLQQIREEYDPHVRAVSRLGAAIKDLGNTAVEEGELRRRAGVTALNDGMREAFADHLIPVKRNGKDSYLWAGTASFAKSCREALAR